MINQSPASDEQRDRVGIVDLLILLVERKKFVLGFAFAVALACAALSFLLPEKFKATAKLLPPQQAQSTAAALLSQLGGVAGLAGGGIKTPSDLYIGMLKSRVVADRLIEKFELKKVYGTDSQEKARQILEENTNIETGKDGLISVAVEYPQQENVAKLTNAYVDELIRMTKSLAVTEAAQRRLFFEQQLELTKNKLADAEAALKVALDRDGVISVDADSRALIETIGRLRAEVSAKEIALNSMSAFVTPNNPSYLKTQEELNSLRAEVSRLENGRPDAGAENKGERKKSGLENIKILRDVKYNQMLYELLAKQYEAARLDEARDPAIIQVLDSAVQPERKVKPKRVVIVLLSLVFGFLAASFWVILKDIIRKASPATRAKLTALGFRK